jgi:acyl-CoA thioesterase FadM
MAWRHSTEAGFDRAWYEARGMNWLVRNVTVLLLAPLTYGDVLSISTEVIGWRHVWVRRGARIRRTRSEDGRGREWIRRHRRHRRGPAGRCRPAKVPAEISECFSTETHISLAVLGDAHTQSW